MVKKFVTVLALLGVLLSLQVSFAAAQEPETYKVKPGDTLESIALYLSNEYGRDISVEDLLAVNGLASEDELQKGMELAIPPAEQEPTGEQPEGEESAGGEGEQQEGEEPAGGEGEQPESETPAGGEVERPEVEKPEGEAPDGGEVEKPEVEKPADGEEEQEGKEPTDAQEPEGEESPDGEEKQKDEELASEEPAEGKQAEEPAAEEAPALRDGSSAPDAEAANDIDVQGSFSPGTGVSKIAVMNIDPGGPVSYELLFYGQNGVDGTPPDSPPPLNYRGVNYHDLATLSLPFGSGWIGSAVIEADREVFAAVDNSYSGGTYTGGDGFNGEAYEAPEAHTDIFLPYATNLGIYRFSRVTVQTTKASGTTNVTLSYKDQNGNDATCSNPTSLSIEARRAESLEPAFNCGGNTDNGSVRLTSSDPIVVVFDGSWGEKAGWKTAYSGIPATKASNTLYYANIFRRSPDNTWVQWSNLFAQNVSDQPVRVRISLYATGAASASMQFEAEIPAQSAKEFNTRFGGTGGFPSAADFGALGNLFAGTAIVEKISGPDNALVGVAHNFWGTFFFGGSTYTAFGADDGANTLYIPFATRRVPGGSWTEWDKGSVMNVTGSAVPVTIKYYDGGGNELLQLGPCTIPDLSVESFNSRYGCDGACCSASDLAVLGDKFQ